MHKRWRCLPNDKEKMAANRQMCLLFGGIPPFLFGLLFAVSFLIGQLIEMPVLCQLLMGCLMKRRIK
jgi:hypothetical protein